MAIARKHHYVPQMYLTGFANDKDQCFVIDAAIRKPFSSSTAKIAAERDYNKIEFKASQPTRWKRNSGNSRGS